MNANKLRSDTTKSGKPNKEQDGWKFGLVKDPAKKEHPCMVPYIQLSIEQKVKDRLFRSIVSAFLNANHQ